MRVHIARPEYKFSCAHMTVFTGGRKERLHGHNYTLATAVELAAGGEMLEFAALKDAMAAECNRLREHLLLPGRSPRFDVLSTTAQELEFRLCGDRYVVPAGDALILPVANVTVEDLATHLLERLAEQLAPALASAQAISLEVTVEESPGQGASSRRSFTR